MMFELIVIIIIMSLDITWLSLKLFKAHKQLEYYKYKQGLDDYD